MNQRIGLIDVDGGKFPKEEWRPAKGFEKYIEVSNLGRVRTYERRYTNSLGRERIVKSRISRTYIMKNGYEVATIVLFDKGSGVCKKQLVHRLVASTFIPNPNNLPQVNHKSEIKSDNSVDNLEWCDATYNLAFGTRREREIAAKSKAVNQYTISGVFVRQFKSITEAASVLGLKITNISAVCLNKPRFKTAGGYKWSFA